MWGRAMATLGAPTPSTFDQYIFNWGCEIIVTKMSLGKVLKRGQP